MFLFCVIEFLSDVNTCLSECARTLKMNGILWAIFRHCEADDPGSPPRHVVVGTEKQAGYSAGEVLYMAKQHGMHVTGLDAVDAYITHNGFVCPYLVLQTRRL